MPTSLIRRMIKPCSWLPLNWGNTNRVVSKRVVSEGPLYPSKTEIIIFVDFWYDSVYMPLIEVCLFVAGSAKRRMDCNIGRDKVGWAHRCVLRTRLVAGRARVMRPYSYGRARQAGLTNSRHSTTQELTRDPICVCMSKHNIYIYIYIHIYIYTYTYIHTSMYIYIHSRRWTFHPAGSPGRQR